VSLYLHSKFKFKRPNFCIW